MTDDVKVLFIAGNGRSGSTILHNILGQIDGFAAVGELRYIWQRGVLKNWLCGCQRPFHDCDEWSEILDHAFGGLSDERAQALFEATESYRSPHLPLVSVPLLRRRYQARLDELVPALAQLYSSIREVTGCRVVVDSSKNPSFGHVVRQVPGVDVHFLHLVRDSPAVAFSWGQEKEFEPGVMMPRKSPAKAAMQWNSRNALTELFLTRGSDAMRLRYEDFLVDPRASVSDIVAWIGEPGIELPFSSSHEAVLERTNHSVFGNEVRFTQGSVMIRPDERWREQMGAADVRKVAALTWPLRRRYGYAGGRRPSAETVEATP